MAIEFTKENFDSEVSHGLCLIDFWAEWCGPCKMIAPTIDELAKEYTGKVKVGKVNVDNEMELAERFGVMSIPTIVIMKDGQEVKRFVGVQPKAVLVSMLDSLL
ncbi:MAG: thioredoxin [Candidatus Hydrogenedentes bacterium]|nr:thioredoxin [Candidatus Hydrogenedentota bacterium]